MDVAADVSFNAASLGTAAWLGWIGPWLPAAVVVLGLRFLWRTRSVATTSASLPEDRPGKLAGVLFYVMVGALSLEAAFGAFGRFSPSALARLADLVFAYAVLCLLSVPARGSRRGTRPSLDILARRTP